MTKLDDLVAAGYAAKILNKAPLSDALDAAATAFVKDPTLIDAAHAEIARIDGICSPQNLAQRCFISAHRREFLSQAVVHPAPTPQAIADEAAAEALPEPAVMPLV
jgi:hypothetical protein